MRFLKAFTPPPRFYFVNFIYLFGQIMWHVQSGGSLTRDGNFAPCRGSVES